MSSERPFKFGQPSEPGGAFSEYRYADVWDRERTHNRERIVAAPSSGHVNLMAALMSELPEPFGLLYVLLVSRRGQRPGRYQSPWPTDRDQTLAFLKEYREYLEQDGRHHLWVTSLPAASTIVYDQHNVVYAYGPLDRFQHLLEVRGLSRTPVAIPVPHTHSYNPEYDDTEERILRHWPWLPFPLHEGD